MWNYKVSSKTNKKKTQDQKCPIGSLVCSVSALLVFGSFGMSKNYCHICNQHRLICLIAKFCAKIRILKFGTKNALFGCFWTEIWKYYCHNWNQLPQICLIPKFGLKLKILKFGTQNALFGYFWTGIWKQYCHVRNQHPRICLTEKFREKMKMPKFGTKNALFGCFWARILKNDYKTIVTFEISILEIVKMRNLVKKWKCLNLGPKIPYLGILGLELKKKLLLYLKSAPSNLTNCEILWNNENA